MNILKKKQKYNKKLLNFNNNKMKIYKMLKNKAWNKYNLIY